MTTILRLEQRSAVTGRLASEYRFAVLKMARKAQNENVRTWLSARYTDCASLVWINFSGQQSRSLKGRWINETCAWKFRTARTCLATLVDGQLRRLNGAEILPT